MDQTPDLICLQEVTEKTDRLWKDGLKKAGYPNIITTFDTTETPDD
jgi:mRNA deadenylase 3'-5' endonuclease subunit Ccr4